MKRAVSTLSQRWSRGSPVPTSMVGAQRPYSSRLFEVGQILKNKGETLSGPTVTITANDTLQNAVAKMSQSRLGSLVVMDKNKVAGIMTERDFLRKLDVVFDGDKIRADVRVGDVMTDNPVCITPTVTLESCIQLMEEYNCRHLPVMAYDDGTLKGYKDMLGMVSIRDVVAQLYAVSVSNPAIQEQFSKITVGAIVEDSSHETSCLTIREESTVLEAMQTMHENNIGGLVVMQSSNQMSGIVTERDFLTDVIGSATPASSLTVGDIMSPNVICVTPDYTFNQVAQIFVTRGIRHLPVMDFMGDADDLDSRPVNLISVRDVCQAVVTAT